MATSSPPVTIRFGSQRYASARFGRSSLRFSGRRSSQRSLLLLRSSRQTNVRPSRTKAVLNTLLTSLVDGIDAVRGCVEEMKGQLPLDGAASSSRMSYYMDMEKQIKALERKIRTLEVHKDRVEEMRDEYILKMKLRDGAINLSQALSSQSSKAAKEKLQAVRVEQRDLIEDLCDIEEELETKLGVFHVRILGLSGLGHRGKEGGGNRNMGGDCYGKEGGSISTGGLRGDLYEVQLRLSNQKWKARCSVTHGQQTWQDEDIIFLGKINDELYVKVLGVRRIHGNTLVGSVKCQSHQLFSFYPQNVTFTFPSSSHLRLNASVHWSPVLGDNFLSDLSLPTLPCLVGDMRAKSSDLPSSISQVQRLDLHPNAPLMMGLSPDSTVEQIRVISANDEKDSQQPGSSYSDMTQKLTWRQKLHREISEEQDFIFMDRRSLTDRGTVEARLREYPGLRHLITEEGTGTDSMEDDRVLPFRGPGAGSGSLLTLSAALEAVLFALEEPLEHYSEVRGLDRQLHRLETVVKGGKLTKAPSMTLSESQALDSFDFLGADDTALLHRMSRISFSEGYESPTFDDGTSAVTPLSLLSKDLEQRRADEEDQCCVQPNVEGGTTGVRSVDIVLIQHLLHCEFLLQHLQSSGPLNLRLSRGLQRLQQEGETISELLNIVVDPGMILSMEKVLPDLYANTELIRFWRTISKDNVLSVSYEQFAVALDSHFGQLLWEDCPKVANQVFAELMGRILDLDVEYCGAVEADMVVTIFQYATFFLEQGRAISVCMKDIARELSLIDGIRDTDLDSRRLLASHLSECGYNHGALLVAGLFLSEEDTYISSCAVEYLSKFTEHSPWHKKAVMHYTELLENSDQQIRVGACLALGELKANSAIPQLLFIAKSDFSFVRQAASTVLSQFGEAHQLPAMQLLVPGDSTPSPAPSLLAPQCWQRRKKTLQRAKSADFPLTDIA